MKTALRQLIVFVCLLPVALKTQAQYTSTELVYGSVLYRKDLLGQLNHAGSYTSGKPLQYIGLGASGMMTFNEKRNISGNLLLAKYLPQSFSVNDSVTGTITGALFGLTAGFDCFPKAKAFDLIFSGGLNLGRLKLIQPRFDFLDYSGNELHRKNMLICPKVSVMTKLYLGKFCLTLNAEYVYDISGSLWKEKLLAAGKPSSVSVPGFNQTGLHFSVALGWATPMGSSNGAHTTAYPHMSTPYDRNDESDE